MPAKKTETMCMPPPRKPRTMVQVEAGGQIYKQVQYFTYYLGGAVTEALDMSVEITRRTRACWMCINQAVYLLRDELYDQPKVALSLKTRMVKAEEIETLLYRCSTWTFGQEHYAKTAPYTTGHCFASSSRRSAHSNERRAAAKANCVRKP